MKQKRSAIYEKINCKKKLDIVFERAYNNTCPSRERRNELSAGVAELADAQDLKSCDPNDRTGSIPVFGTTLKKHFNIAGWSSLVARRAHNPEVVGSNPAPATKFTITLLWRRSSVG